jgi:UDP-N-acetylglucosamine 2-epimerase (non-hydrolysing)
LPPEERFRLIQPLSYRDNLRLIQCAHAVFTDSGGIQEETSVLQVPCLTLRQNSERPITVELGSSELVGNDPARIRDTWERMRSGQWKTPSKIPLWDGRAAARIVGHLRNAWGEDLSRDVDKRENIQ